MNAKELVAKLARHPVVVSDMAMQVQLGLPYLEKRNGRLCIFFKPHHEAVQNDSIAFYAPQYEIAWVIPFDRLISFNNLLYSSDVDLENPVQTISICEYAKRGTFLVEELYRECSRVLSIYETDGTVSDVTVKKYQKIYFEVVRDLELEAVYGDGYV